MKAGEVLKWGVILVALYLGWKLLSGAVNGFAGQITAAGGAIPYNPNGVIGADPYAVQSWAPWGYQMTNFGGYRETPVRYRGDNWDPASAGYSSPWYANLGNVSFGTGNVAGNIGF